MKDFRCTGLPVRQRTKRTCRKGGSTVVMNEKLASNANELVKSIRDNIAVDSPVGHQFKDTALTISAAKYRKALELLADE